MSSEAVIIRRYPHPLSRVYHAWTRVEHLERWFRPFDDVALTVESFDFREGGDYAFRYTWPGHVFPVSGRFLTIRPEQTLVFTWLPQEPDPDAGKDTMVSVFFRDLGREGTEVEVRHTLFPDDPMRRRHDEGWSATLDRLGRHLFPTNHTMTATELASRFYELNNAIPEGKAGPAELERLLAPGFVFTGPLMKVEGAVEFMAMLGQFMPFHESVTVRRQIADGNTVCSLTRLALKTPSGEPLAVDVSEWLETGDDRIQSLTIYYDPRGFAAAFSL